MNDTQAEDTLRKQLEAEKLERQHQAQLLHGAEFDANERAAEAEAKMHEVEAAAAAREEELLAVVTKRAGELEQEHQVNSQLQRCNHSYTIGSFRACCK